eukprot:1394339-Amorphochlora_amoeboformis.AAC.3
MLPPGSNAESRYSPETYLFLRLWIPVQSRDDPSGRGLRVVEEEGKSKRGGSFLRCRVVTPLHFSGIIEGSDHLHFSAPAEVENGSWLKRSWRLSKDSSRSSETVA